MLLRLAHALDIPFVIPRQFIILGHGFHLSDQVAHAQSNLPTDVDTNRIGDTDEVGNAKSAAFQVPNVQSKPSHDDEIVLRH